MADEIIGEGKTWPPAPNFAVLTPARDIDFLALACKMGRWTIISMYPLVLVYALGVITGIPDVFRYYHHPGPQPVYTEAENDIGNTIDEYVNFPSNILLSLWFFLCFASQSKRESWFLDSVRGSLLVNLPVISCVMMPILLPGLFKSIAESGESSFQVRKPNLTPLICTLAITQAVTIVTGMAYDFNESNGFVSSIFSLVAYISQVAWQLAMIRIIYVIRREYNTYNP